MSQRLLGKIAVFYINNATLAYPSLEVLQGLHIMGMYSYYNINTDNRCQENP